MQQRWRMDTPRRGNTGCECDRRSAEGRRTLLMSPDDNRCRCEYENKVLFFCSRTSPQGKGSHKSRDHRTLSFPERAIARSDIKSLGPVTDAQTKRNGAQQCWALCHTGTTQCIRPKHKHAVKPPDAGTASRTHTTRRHAHRSSPRPLVAPGANERYRRWAAPRRVRDPPAPQTLPNRLRPRRTCRTRSG